MAFRQSPLPNAADPSPAALSLEEAKDLAKRLERHRGGLDVAAWAQLMGMAAPITDPNEAWDWFLQLYFGHLYPPSLEPTEPARVPPGPEKVPTLRRRRRQRQSLFGHAQDATLTDRHKRAVSRPNNNTDVIGPLEIDHGCGNGDSTPH